MAWPPWDECSKKCLVEMRGCWVRHGSDGTSVGRFVCLSLCLTVCYMYAACRHRYLCARVSVETVPSVAHQSKVDIFVRAYYLTYTDMLTCIQNRFTSSNLLEREGESMRKAMSYGSVNVRDPLLFLWCGFLHRLKCPFSLLPKEQYEERLHLLPWHVKFNSPGFGVLCFCAQCLWSRCWVYYGVRCSIYGLEVMILSVSSTSD